MMTELHPIAFKEKWNLNWTQLASVLRYDNDQTVRSWGGTWKESRKPKGIVLLTCALLDEKWTKEGRPNFF